MGPLPERLVAKEPAFALEAEDLRGQIAALTVQLGDVAGSGAAADCG